MKVVHICMQDFAGAGNAAYRLHKGLCEIGVDSTMLVYSKKSQDITVKVLPESFQGDKLRCLDKDEYLSASMQKNWVRWLNIQKSYPNRPPKQELFTDYFTEAKLDKLIEIQEADIINLHWVAGVLDYSIFADLCRNKKVVWTFHDMNAFTGGCHYSSDCTQYLSRCFKCPQLGSVQPNDLAEQAWNLKNSAYQKADFQVITPSRWLADCARKSSLLKNKPVEVIPYGFPLDLYKPADINKLRDKYGINRECRLVSFVAGSLDNTRKGFEYLLKALKHLESNNQSDNIVLGAVGRVPADFSSGLKIPFKAFGFVEDPQVVAEIYAMSDVFVIPSLEDNLPNTVVESLACGTPVAGFNIGGIPDMIEHQKTGFLAEYLSAESLAQGIKWVLNNLSPEVRKLCRNNAEKYFNLHLQAKRYLQVYNRLLNNAVESPSNTKNLQAKELAEAGKIIEAIALFEEITIAEPLHFKANFNLGILYSQQNELKKAARCYLKCLEAKANDRNTVINLTYILKNLDKAAEAEKILAAYLLENYDDQEMKNLLVALSEGKEVAKKPDLVKQEFKSTLVYIDPGYQDSFGHYMQMGRNIRDRAETQGIEVLHFVNKNVSGDIIKNEKLIPLFQDIAFITNKTADYYRVLSDFEAKLIEVRNLLSNRDDKQIVIYMYTAHPLHFPIFARVFGECKTNNFDIVLNLFYLDNEFCNGNLDNYYDYLLRKCYEEFLACNRNNKIKIVFESKHASSRYLSYFGEREIFDAQPVAKINPLSYKHGSSSDKTMIAYIGHTNEKSGYHLVYQAYKMLIQTAWQNKIHFKIKHSKKFFNAEFLKMYEEFTMQSRSIEHFNGFLSAEDYHNFYNDCDIVLLPYSKKHYPVQTSGVLVDAVLAKKIVIASKDTWLGDIVEKYHFGVTFQSDNLADFTNAIIEVVGKIGQYKALIENNYQEFAWQHSADNLLKQLGFNLKPNIDVKIKKSVFCPSCGSSNLSPLRDLIGQRTKKKIKLYQCPQCLTLFNPSDYHEDDKALELDTLWHIDKIDRNKLMGQDLLTELLVHHPQAKSFLDIGAGVGSLMLSAAKFGLLAEGVELNKFAVDYALKNLGLRLKDSYYQAGLYDRKFDIITIVMVLEHLEEPAKLLVQAVKDLNTDGLIFISVPFYYPEQHNKYLENPDLEGTPFFANDVHITHFTDNGFIQMCKKLGATYIKKINKGWSGYILKFN